MKTSWTLFFLVINCFSFVFPSLVCPEESTICFDVKINSTDAKFLVRGPPELGYISLGLGTTMKDSEIFVAFFDTDGSPQVSYHQGIGYKPPKLVQNTSLTIVKEESQLSKDYQTITFIRSLESILPDGIMIKSNSSINIIWAISAKKPEKFGSIGIHSKFGALTFSPGSDDNKSSGGNGVPLLVLIHGIMMIISWLVLPPMAIFVARFLKAKLGHLWFQLHTGLLMLTGLLSVISILIIYAKTGDRFQTPHSILGIIVIALYLFQCLLGLVIDKLWKQNRKAIPIRDKLHWWLGRSTMLLALADIVFGIILVKSPSYLWITLGAILAVIVGSFVFGHYVIKVQKH